jgi:hypothetical protein
LIRLHRQRPDAVVFHSYDWGGYLTWRGWQPSGPRLLNWIDDRNEVQGQEHVQEYFAILDAKPGWQAKLDRDRVELVCVEGGAPLAQRLAELDQAAETSESSAGTRSKSGQWHKVAAYDQLVRNRHFEAVIFERYLDPPH